jgi:hypothetical protein
MNRLDRVETVLSKNNELNESIGDSSLIERQTLDVGAKLL